MNDTSLVTSEYGATPLTMSPGMTSFPMTPTAMMAPHQNHKANHSVQSHSGNRRVASGLIGSASNNSNVKSALRKDAENGENVKILLEQVDTSQAKFSN